MKRQQLEAIKQKAMEEAEKEKSKSSARSQKRILGLADKSSCKSRGPSLQEMEASENSCAAENNADKNKVGGSCAYLFLFFHLVVNFFEQKRWM